MPPVLPPRPPPQNIFLALQSWLWQGNPLNVSNSAGSGATLTTLQIVSTITAAQLPFTVGLPQFPKGKTQGPLSLNLANQQVIIRSRWSDNSVKHAIASGHASLTTGVPLLITVLETSGSGTNLTNAQVAAALAATGQNVVNCGVNGSVDLTTLLASPKTTVFAGPQMIYNIYSTTLSNNLYVEFQVMYYLFGRAHIRAIIGNGYIDVATSPNSYTCTITIGGTNVVGPTAITHNIHTDVMGKGWVGGDPLITPIHNVTDIVNSKLVPNYFMDPPPVTLPGGAVGLSLSTMTQTYTRGTTGDWTPHMGDVAFHNQIGWLPGWDAMFITSRADSRAYNSVIANAEILPSTYGIVWRGQSDNNIVLRPSIYPTSSFDGAGGGFGTPGYTVDGGTTFWEDAHHGSAGYLAYLLTGDFYFLQIMQYQAAMCWLSETRGNGRSTGTSLQWFNAQTRGMAWRLRTCCQLTAVSPTGDSVATDYAAVQATQIAFMKTTSQLSGQNQLGVYYDNEVQNNSYSTTTAVGAPWQHDYLSHTLAMGVDIQNLSSMTDWTLLDSIAANYAILRMTDGSSGQYQFAYAANYNLIEGPTPSVTDFRTLYATWNQVYAAPGQFGPGSITGVTNIGNTNILQGVGSAQPSAACDGYWGYLLPSIAAAVDHGYPGSQAGWNRMVGASNWLTLRNCIGNSDNFSTIPIFGIGPRDALQTQVAKMNPGTWATFGTNTLSSVAYNGPFAATLKGTNGPAAICYAWCGAAWDSVNKLLTIPIGGGHVDYLGNESYAFSTVTGTWSLIRGPSDPTNWTTTIDTMPDGQPVARHTYSGFAFRPVDGCTYMVGGAISPSPSQPDTSPSSSATWKYDPIAKIWTQVATFVGTSQYTEELVYDPGGDKLYAIGPAQTSNGGLMRFDPANPGAGWTALSNTGSNTNGENATGCLDPTSLKILVIGGGVMKLVDIATGVVTNITNTVSGDTTPIGISAPGAAWYPSAGKFVIWGGATASTGTPNVWIFDRVANTLTSHPPNPANTVTPTSPAQNPGSGTTDGTYGRWQYISYANCFLLQNATTDSVYVYKPDF